MGRGDNGLKMARGWVSKYCFAFSEVIQHRFAVAAGPELLGGSSGAAAAVASSLQGRRTAGALHGLWFLRRGVFAGWGSADLSAKVGPRSRKITYQNHGAVREIRRFATQSDCGGRGFRWCAAWAE